MHKKHTIKIRRATFLGLLFFVVLGLLIINNNSAQAALLNPYNKLNGGTLQASEWNNLLADFVTKNNGGDNLFGDYTITGTLASSTYALDITGALRATSVTGALSGTLSSANVSAGLFGDNTGGGNYNFPANIGIGIGTTTPPSIITLANDRWVSARNSAGNGYVNIFKVNANDEIEMGSTLNIGNFQFAADSGFNTFVDMPVTSASPNDSIQGYVMKIDGDNILSVFSQSDGLGGIKNRRIGINTSTPQFDLDVAGIINATDIYVNGAPYIGSQWTTNGTSIYYNTGNVGIGTTNPGAMLDVIGAGRIDGLLTVGSTAQSASMRLVDSNGSTWQLGSGIVGNHYFNIRNNTNGSLDALAIDYSGNVGIGTTSPQALLDVNGLIKMRSSTITANEDVVNKGYLDSALASTTAGIISQVATSSFWQGSLTGNVYNANTGNVGIGTTNPGLSTGSPSLTISGQSSVPAYELWQRSDSLSPGSSFGSISWFGGSTADNTGNIKVLNADTGEDDGHMVFETALGGVIGERMRITNDGNVGIGTTAPNRILEIAGSGQTGRLRIKDTGSSGAGVDAGVEFVGSDDAVKGFVGEWDSDSQDVDLRAQVGGLNFVTAGNDAMYINTLGNVGIGTTTPIEKMQMNNGNLFISSDTLGAAMGTAIKFGRPAGYSSGWFSAITPYTTTGYDRVGLQFYTSTSGGSLSRMTLAPTGEISIGTTNPTSKLAVSGGNIFINDAAITSATPKAAITKEYLTSTLDAFNSETNLWKLNGSNLYASTTDWNVGIGTTNPASKLDINIPLTNSNGITLNTNDEVYSIWSNSNLGALVIAGSIVGDTARYDLTVRESTGNIGIGTASPDKELVVSSLTNIHPRLKIDSNLNGSSAGIIFESQSSGGTIRNFEIDYNAGGRILTFAGEGSDLMSISTNTGNVGIGTTNPTYKLQVTGDAYVSGTMRLVDGYGINWSSGSGSITTTGGSSYSMLFSTYNGSANTEKLRITGSGNVGIGTTTPDSRLSVSGGNIFINDAAITSGTPKAAITKEYLTSTLDAFNTETNLWRLNGSTVYSSSTDWNVGIGVNSASYPLVVHSDTAGTVAEFRNSVGNVAYINITDNSTGSGTSNGLTLGYNGQAMIYNRENTPMVFSTNDTGRMRIAASGGVSIGSTYVSNDPGTSSLIVEGNLGLGTTNPTTKLDVEGVIRTTAGVIAPLTTGDALYSSAGNNDVNIWKISNAGNSYGFYQKYVGTGSGDANALELWTTGEVNNDLLVYHVRQSGNMGFGTTNPSTAKIVIATSTNGYTLDAGNFKIGNVATPTFNLDAANKAYVDSTIAAATSSITLWGGITSGNVWSLNFGNVGIGTSNPEAKLDVNSSYSSTGDTYGFRSVLSPGASINSNTHRAIYGEAIQTGYYSSGHTIIGTQGLAGRTSYAGGTETIGVLGKAVYNENHNYTYPAYNHNSRMVGVKSEIEVTYANTGTDHLKNAYGFYARGLNVSGTSVNNWYGLYISPTVATGGGVINNKYGIYQEESTAKNYFSGSIGIGTTTPDSRLSVSGGNIFINDAAITSGTPKAAITKEYLTSTLDAFNSETNLWKLNGSNLYASTTDWNVGIGTTNPLSKLHLNGGTGTIATGLSFGDGDTGIYESSDDTLNIARNGNSIFYFDNYGLRSTTGNNILLEGSTYFGWANRGAARISAPSSGNVAIEYANLGIGTTSPTSGYLLDVNGAIRSNTTVFANGGSFVSFASGNTTLGASTYGVGGGIGYGSSRLQLWAASGHNMGFGVGGTEIMRITSTGNVGISTTTPDSKLSVSGGNILINDWNITSATPKAAITKEYLDSAFDTIVGDNVGSGTPGQTLRHDGTSWVANSVLFNDGTNVGIGTSNPNYKLDVNGGINMAYGQTFSINTNLFMAQAYTPGYQLQFGLIKADYKNFFEAWTDRVQLVTAGVSRLYVNNTGNVGVGTTNPDAKLQVQGTLKLQNVVSSSPDTNFRRMINVASYNGGGTYRTGILTVKLPSPLAHSMAKIKISGWSYGQAWDVTVSGYLNTTQWTQVGGTVVTGNPPFDTDQIRLVADSASDTFYILLGDAATTYGYYASIGVDVDSIYSNNLPSTGWDIYIAASDPSFDYVTTPASSLYGSHGADINNGNVYINDAVITSGTPKAAITKEYLTSTLDAFNSETNLWKLNGSNLYASTTTWNVGIGTTAPAAKLDIQGTTGGTAAWFRGGNSAFNIQTKDNLIELVSFNGSTYSPINIRAAGSGLTIDTSGNIGVGTSNPGGILDVFGSLPRFTEDSNGGNLEMELVADRGDNVQDFWKIVAHDGLSTTEGMLTFNSKETGSYNSILSLKGGGNVGIGLTNPASKLDVAGDLIIRSGAASGTIYSNGGNFIMTQNYSSSFETILASIGSVRVALDTNNNDANKAFIVTGNSLLAGNELFKVNESGNVGISTSTESSRLDVAGGNVFIHDASITSGTPKAAITKEYLDSAFATIVGDNVGSGTTGQTLRHDGTSWVANSLLFNNGTNVGIGTTSPIYPLTVVAPVSSNVFGMTDGTRGVLIQTQSSPSNGGIIGHYNGSYNDLDIRAKAGTGSQLYLTTGGNVGIGTTAPSTPLTVHAGSHEVLTLQRAGSTNGWGVWSKFRLQNSVSTYVDYGYIGGGITSNTAGAHTGYLGFGTAQAGALVETMRLSSNGSLQIDGALAVDGTTNSYIQGKVGIGATTPTDKLHVVGSARFSDAINNLYVLPTTSLSVEGPFVSYLGRELRLGIYDNAGHRSGFVINNPNNETETAYISTRVGNSERMRLLGNGNVGIGTTTPDSRLSVSGGNIFINDAAITSGTPKAAITKEYLTSALDAFNSESNLWKLNGSNLYASTTNWNVGIGTTNPNTKLQIANTDAASTSGQDTLKLTGVLSASVVGSGPVLRFTDSNGTSNMSSIRGYTFGSGATGLAFETGWNANTIRMVIDNSGNVGIGTTAPGKRLEVFDSDNVQLLVSGWNTVGTNEASGSIQIGDHPTIHGKVQFNGATGAIYIDNFFDNVGGDIHFRNRVSGTPVNSMTIGGDGNVGIGTTNPGSYKLYVNGDTNINGTLTATSVIGPVTGTLNAANVSSGAFGGNTGGGNYSFPGKLSVGTTSVSSAGLLVNGAVEMARTGLFGTYSSSEVQGIWTIGNGYQISTANNDFGSQYGMVYAHTSAGTGGAKKPIAGWGHQILFTNSGNYTAAISLGSGNAYFGGVVGIGTTAPGSPLHVRSASATPKKMLILDTESATDGTASIIHFVSSTDENVGSQISGFRTGSNGLSALTFSTYNSGIQERLRIDSSGNVGIGTTDPGVYRLKVAGDVAITGTLQTQTGSDFAEEFSVLSDLEAGTVVTMAEEGYKSVRAANKAYDSQVVGIVSDNPSIIAGRVKSEKKVVVAMMGVVSVKVSDINGEVRKGDLLTSSSISGYAMKAVDYRPGTIIGKALEDLTGKSGSIKVLVNLQ